MGFNFKNAIHEVSVELTVYQRMDGVLSEAKVLHVFRHPTAPELDSYRGKLASFKGKKTKVNFSAASAYLWAQCIERVEGYDELPEEWKKFFLTDDIGRIRSASAVDELLAVASPDGDFEKN